MERGHYIFLPILSVGQCLTCCEGSCHSFMLFSGLSCCSQLFFLLLSHAAADFCTVCRYTVQMYIPAKQFLAVLNGDKEKRRGEVERGVGAGAGGCRISHLPLSPCTLSMFVGGAGASV